MMGEMEGRLEARLEAVEEAVRRPPQEEEPQEGEVSHRNKK